MVCSCTVDGKLHIHLIFPTVLRCALGHIICIISAIGFRMSLKAPERHSVKLVPHSQTIELLLTTGPETPFNYSLHLDIHNMPDKY